MFSIIIPAYNEAAVIERTCRSIIDAFAEVSIADYEILVINDGSTDDTGAILRRMHSLWPTLRYRDNDLSNGFGFAVRCGLDHYEGTSACIVMADGSDDPSDIVRYYHAMRAGAECVFGSRFIRGSVVENYPGFKHVINRIANHGVRILFGIHHNDITNAFKCYRRDVIDGLRPLLSNHFNLTVEMPLKAIVRGYGFETIPIAWRNRRVGASNLSLREMGSRYAFIVAYVWLEKMLAKGDYYRRDRAQRSRPRPSSLEAGSAAPTPENVTPNASEGAHFRT